MVRASVKHKRCLGRRLPLVLPRVCPCAPAGPSSLTAKAESKEGHGRARLFLCTRVCVCVCVCACARTVSFCSRPKHGSHLTCQGSGVGSQHMAAFGSQALQLKSLKCALAQPETVPLAPRLRSALGRTSHSHSSAGARVSCASSQCFCVTGAQQCRHGRGCRRGHSCS